MATFRVRCYDNPGVRWIEIAGAATATPAARVRAEIAAAFNDGMEGPDERRHYVLDLSQLVTIGGPTLEAVFDAVPEAREVSLIPPPQAGWFAAFNRRIDLTMGLFASEKHALLALRLESRGEVVKRIDEHRRAPRVETAIRTGVWFDHPHGPRFGRALVANLSRTGALLASLDCPLDRDEVRHFIAGMAPLTLDIPIGLSRHRFRSRVVRLDTGRGAGVPLLGVRFEEVQPEQESALDRFIAQRVPEGDIAAG